MWIAERNMAIRYCGKRCRRRPEHRKPSAEHEDAGRDEGEGERDAGSEKGVFLRKVGSRVSASDTIRSVGRGLEFHIVFPMMQRADDRFADAIVVDDITYSIK